MMSVWSGYSLQQQSPTRKPGTKEKKYIGQSKTVGEGVKPDVAKCFGRRSKASNRRTGTRVASKMEIVMRSLKSKRSRNTPIKAQIKDISSGGICITLKRALPLSSVLRCEFKMADSGVSVPSLMQVRWVEPVKGGEYRCGLLHLV